jgi:hypothetical protein
MRTTDKLQFTEYTLQVRHGPRHAEQGPMGDWKDATGYNNLTGTYNHLHQMKAQITRTRKSLERWYQQVEFRALARQVTRTEWSEVDLHAEV